MENEIFSVYFFPKSWSLDRLVIEVEHAFRNKSKEEKSVGKYIGASLSGVPIIFIISSDKKILSVYPLFME